MIGKKMTLSQTMRLVNFDAIQLQFFDVQFNSSNGIATPKLLRKITINKMISTIKKTLIKLNPINFSILLTLFFIITHFQKLFQATL